MKFKSFLLILIVSAATLVATPPVNAAEKGWRYWGYFQAGPGKTSWTTAMTGPTVDVADGSVEGWSFVFSSQAVPSTPPKAKPDFAKICANTQADPDTKRVALVIDFGSRTYAPKGEKIQKRIIRCVTTAKQSQGIDILGQVVKIRSASSGLICGLNEYPAKECGLEIATPRSLVVKK